MLDRGCHGRARLSGRKALGRRLGGLHRQSGAGRGGRRVRRIRRQQLHQRAPASFPRFTFALPLQARPLVTSGPMRPESPRSHSVTARAGRKAYRGPRLLCRLLRGRRVRGGLGRRACLVSRAARLVAGRACLVRRAARLVAGRACLVRRAARLVARRGLLVQSGCSPCRWAGLPCQSGCSPCPLAESTCPPSPKPRLWLCHVHHPRSWQSRRPGLSTSAHRLPWALQG